MPTLRVKVYAHFCYRFSTKGESLGIIPQVDLLHCGVGILIEFQLNDVQTRVGKHNHINSAIWRMHFNIYQEVCQEREDDEKHLLIMSFIVGVVAVRHCLEESLQQLECSVHIVLSNILIIESVIRNM